MKKNVFFIVMLTGMLSFAFSAEKGLILNVPSALAGDSEDSKDSKDKDSKDSKDKDSKDSKDKDSKDSKDKDSKDNDSKDSNSDSGENANNNGSNNGSCVCPPGISSCICANGATGTPGAGSSPTAPNSLRSVHGD